MITRQDVIDYLSKLQLGDIEELLSEVKSIDEGFPDGLQPIGGPIPIYGCTFNGPVAYGPLEPKYDNLDWSFEVYLKSIDVGSSRVKCMHLIRKTTKWTMLECKEAVDNIESGKYDYILIDSRLSKEEAEDIKRSFAEIGGRIAIRGLDTGAWYSKDT